MGFPLNVILFYTLFCAQNIAPRLKRRLNRKLEEVEEVEENVKAGRLVAYLVLRPSRVVWLSSWVGAKCVNLIPSQAAWPTRKLIRLH